jgi:site-specific DNA-adenine methylase
VYLDPPYANPDRTTTGEYGPGCFAATDFPHLWGSLRDLDTRGVQFMLSFCDSGLVPSELPSHWTRRTCRVRRHVSGFAAKRKIARELIITNYMAPLTR